MKSTRNLKVAEPQTNISPEILKIYIKGKEKVKNIKSPLGHYDFFLIPKLYSCNESHQNGIVLI